jgi:hypothetical protein
MININMPFCNNFGAVGKRARMLGLTPFSFTDTDVILHLSSPGKWKQKAGNSMGRCSNGWRSGKMKFSDVL